MKKNASPTVGTQFARAVITVVIFSTVYQMLYALHTSTYIIYYL